MARIPPVGGWKGALLRRGSRASRPLMRRMMGIDRAEPFEPVALAAHSGWIAQAHGFYELALARSRSADFKLKEIARMRAGTLHGCPW
jgi:hypothetical protein